MKLTRFAAQGLDQKGIQKAVILIQELHQNSDHDTVEMK